MTIRGVFSAVSLRNFSNKLSRVYIYNKISQKKLKDFPVKS